MARLHTNSRTWVSLRQTPLRRPSKAIRLSSVILAFLSLLITSSGIWAGDLTLAWTSIAEPGLTGYELHYGGQSGQYSTSIQTTATQHKVTDLTAGSTYYFSVKAVHSDPTLNSVFSNEVSATVAQPHADTTAPTVVSTTPISGATGVAVGTLVTSVFSEGINSASLTNSTFELRDAGNVLIPAAVAYAATTRTATLKPSSALTASRTYRATLKGGTSGVKDLAGNALGSDVTWSFATAQAGSGVCGSGCSAWTSSIIPKTLADSDTAAVELGVKFRSDISGFVTGVRFYKGSVNTGTHVGSLWSANGTRLASATFVNETASGWQQVNFATPVAISANTLYVASYHAPKGGYSIDTGYFGSVGVDKAPLHVPASGASGGNGVYRYGTSGFPNQTWNSSNYWVDVVFNDTSPASAPKAGFTVSTTQGVAPMTVGFTDTSSGQIDSWSWTFADGGTSTQASPSHTFNQPGSYSVTLKVTGPGGSATATAVISVAAPTPPPVAAFDASPTSGLAPLTVSFSDRSTGDVTSRSWVFGEGGTSTAAQAVYTYKTPGIYSVSLTVSGAGGSDQLTKNQLINASGPPPVADFAAVIRQGPAPLSVAFQNISGGETTAVRWDFGDGTSSTEKSPSHVYLNPGRYDVTLTVTGPYGSDAETKLAFVDVTKVPTSVLEVGEVLANHTWQWVEFARAFVAPIVVANPPSANDAAPAVVRISGVKSTGFWIRIQEWDYLDGIHAFETVSYLVMEKGTHPLPSGERIEAGHFTQGGRALSSIGFAASFSTVPVVMTSVTSNNDAKAVTTRVRNVTRDGFELRLNEQESITTGHGAETISYIAWPLTEGTFEGLKFAVRKSGNTVTHKVSNLSFGSGWGQVPAFLGQMQTINGGDTATLRYRNRSSTGVGLWVQEEQSKDLEVTHGKETVGWIIFNDSQ